MSENECEDLISDQANQQTSMEMKGRMKHRYTVYQVRSHVEPPGPSDFSKISNELLFIMKPILTGFSAGFTPPYIEGGGMK
jgi:hypothetical protein